ncbi:MAG: hypothetical protein JNL58_22135, partial [Planctomyces sp.]|nr:hypothetical protein [Planctomyces sp.]
ISTSPCSDPFLSPILASTKSPSIQLAATKSREEPDKVIGITGVNFSTDRQVRLAQLKDAGESVLAELQELEADYNQQMYPEDADIERFMISEDVVVISAEDLQMVNEIVAKNAGSR